jgi:hypothetical protein
VTLRFVRFVRSTFKDSTLLSPLTLLYQKLLALALYHIDEHIFSEECLSWPNKYKRTFLRRATFVVRLLIACDLISLACLRSCWLRPPTPIALLHFYKRLVAPFLGPYPLPTRVQRAKAQEERDGTVTITFLHWQRLGRLLSSKSLVACPARDRAATAAPVDPSEAGAVHVLSNRGRASLALLLARRLCKSCTNRVRTAPSLTPLDSTESGWHHLRSTLRFFPACSAPRDTFDRSRSCPSPSLTFPCSHLNSGQTAVTRRVQQPNYHVISTL